MVAPARTSRCLWRAPRTVVAPLSFTFPCHRRLVGGKRSLRPPGGWGPESGGEGAKSSLDARSRGAWSSPMFKVRPRRADCPSPRHSSERRSAPPSRPLAGFSKIIWIRSKTTTFAEHGLKNPLQRAFLLRIATKSAALGRKPVRETATCHYGTGILGSPALEKTRVARRCLRRFTVFEGRSLSRRAVVDDECRMECVHQKTKDARGKALADSMAVANQSAWRQI
jgi:hypothetical protein